MSDWSESGRGRRTTTVVSAGETATITDFSAQFIRGPGRRAAAARAIRGPPRSGRAACYPPRSANSAASPVSVVHRRDTSSSHSASLMVSGGASMNQSPYLPPAVRRE